MATEYPKGEDIVLDSYLGGTHNTDDPGQNQPGYQNAEAFSEEIAEEFVQAVGDVDLSDDAWFGENGQDKEEPGWKFW